MSIIKNIVSNVWQRVSCINDVLFRKGGNFSKWETNDDLGISEQDGNKYQPSSGRIKKVFKHLPISINDSILDIGCGKGRAMFMMHSFDFGVIDGFDLSERMVSLANSNFSKTQTNDRCHAFCADAATFTEYGKYNYFYAFNPVPEKVFYAMMDNIVKNLQETPRRCYFIYLNPMYDEYIQKSTPFVLERRYKGVVTWDDVCVYKYES